VLRLIVGIGLLAAIDAVFAPWSFFIGGRFHALLWQGIGTMHSASVDYVLYVWMSPQPGGRMFNFPYFTGSGYLCVGAGLRLVHLGGTGVVHSAERRRRNWAGRIGLRVQP
jgi:hypothetical protein